MINTAFLATRGFKILGSLATVGCIVLGLMLLSAKMDVRSLTKTVAQRDAQIVVLNSDLAQARTNVATLRSGVDRQNAEIRRLSEESKTRTAAAETKVAAAKAETASAKQRAANALAYQPKGETPAERMLDVDRRFLETLK